MHSSSRKARSLTALTALTAAALLWLPAACSVNPATGDVNLMLMNEKEEKKIGEQEHAKLMETVRLSDDEDLVAYVTEIGNRVAATSHRPDMEFQFFVIDSPEINAFALPGGYVYINRGLMLYMNSEADLAAVLGHEIGHITARHAVQQNSKGALTGVLAQVGGFMAAVATGSGYIGSQIAQVGSVWAQVGLSGFGRDHELEADRLGALYLLRAGYDPQAMINVVTVLKDHENFRRKINPGKGGGYHGLFASHPRNDSRLHEIVASVGELPESEALAVDESRFREALEGVPIGAGAQPRVTDERNRYYQTLLGYTMVFPDDWEIEETPTTVEAKDPAAGSLQVEARRIRHNIEPRVFIRDHLGVTDLQKTESLRQYRLLGYTGVTTADNGNPQRIAVIYFGPRVFIFRGEVFDTDDAAAIDAIDAELLKAVKSFRAIQRGEVGSENGQRITWVQASPHFDYAVVAKDSPLPAQHAEQYLRLLNGHYPRGQPEAGDWVKLVVE